jgi:hypothetical protein
MRKPRTVLEGSPAIRIFDAEFDTSVTAGLRFIEQSKMAALVFERSAQR